MIEKIPEGTIIGEMSASLDWVLSHTARFAGAVVVTIQESRGFILIDKGKPLAYYFRHGKRVLKGHNAYEYFRSQPHLRFELRRYSPEDMAIVMDIVVAEDKKTPQMESVFLIVDAGQERPDTNSSGPVEIPRQIAAISSMAETEPQTASGEERSAYDMTPEELAAAVLQQMPVSEPLIPEERAQEDEESIFGEYIPEERTFATEDEMVANVGELLLGQILSLSGVIAVSIFKRGMNVLSIGDMSLENLIDVAEDLIESAREVSTVMRTGPFVQMTLQIPAGNIIIAPYWDEYLCILTDPGVNIGQIRKILREIPTGNKSRPIAPER